MIYESRRLDAQLFDFKEQKGLSGRNPLPN